MRSSRVATWSMAAALCLAGASLLWQAKAHAADAATAGRLDNETCLGCHAKQGFAAKGADGKARALHVIRDKFGRSVHGKRACVDCHTDITEIPHKASATAKVSCVNCHDALWRAASRGEDDRGARAARRGGAADRPLHEVHPCASTRDDQSRSNAICYDCHAPHYVYPKGSAERAEWRLSIPDVCGKCHAKEREQYAASVHGKAVLRDKNPAAAICSDCHTTHDIADPAKDSAKLAITKNCGGCHADKPEDLHRHLPRAGEHAGLRLYGQVLRLPRQPRHPEGERSESGDASGQPPQDLPEMPRRRDRGLRHVRTPRHVPRFRPLSAYLDRVQVHAAADRRHLCVLLDAYRPVVLPRIQGAQGAQAAAAREDRRIARWQVQGQAITSASRWSGASPI